MIRTILSLTLAVLLSSCNAEKNPSDKLTLQPGDSATRAMANSVENVNKVLSWSGRLEGNIPVFIHFQEDSNVVVGEILYKNSKAKTAIKLIGNIDRSESGALTYRLNEFDKTGQITGILMLKKSSDSLTGEWYSPDSKKTRWLRLEKKDTAISISDIHTDIKHISGSYSYAYGKDGPEGGFDIKVDEKGVAIFDLSAVTSAPARNLADIPEDTVQLTKPAFVYILDDIDNCEIGFKFYKNFVYVYYPKENCSSSFGYRATAEGIFLKQ